MSPEEAQLTRDNMQLGLRLLHLEAHVVALVDKTPDGATMTIVADSPWMKEAKRLLGRPVVEVSGPQEQTATEVRSDITE